MSAFHRDVLLRRQGLLVNEIQYDYSAGTRLGCACGDCKHFAPDQKVHAVKPDGWCCLVKVYSVKGKCRSGCEAKAADAVHRCEKFQLRKI